MGINSKEEGRDLALKELLASRPDKPDTIAAARHGWPWPGCGRRVLPLLGKQGQPVRRPRPALCPWQRLRQTRTQQQSMAGGRPGHRKCWLGLCWGERWGRWPLPLAPSPPPLPGGRWQGCMLQGSTSLGLDSCRLPQRLGGPRAQMTWRLRVPPLQLLEHWGPRGGRGKREQAHKKRPQGWGSPQGRGVGGR